METLCFEGYYTKRFARYKEFCPERVEVKLDEFLKKFCNRWLEEEYELQRGAKSYERTERRTDRRNGHYWRRLVTGRGVMELRVPRGEKKKYVYTLFEKNQRKTKKFEEIVVDGLLKGHSSRKASAFFEKMFGAGTISHQAAVSTLKKFDWEVKGWKNSKVKDGAVVLVLDAVHLKGRLRAINRLSRCCSLMRCMQTGGKTSWTLRWRLGDRSRLGIGSARSCLTGA